MTILDRLDRIEEKREAVLNRARAMDTEALAARPAPDQWSILEIVEHLVLAEEDVVGDLNELKPRRRSWKSRLLYALVMLILRSPIPVKAPSRGMIPSGEASLEELAERWRANHRSFRRYVEQLDPEDMESAVFRHPISGPMTLEQSVRMLEVHLDRHAKQVAEVEESVAGTTPVSRS